MAFSDDADRRAAETIKDADLKSMKVRERVTFGVRARIEAVMEHKEAARRAAAVFALPQNALDGATCVYRTVDNIWRAVGDTSADFNFYTKRALLAGVYTSTMLYWFADTSEDAARHLEIPRQPHRRRDADRESEIPSLQVRRVASQSADHPGRAASPAPIKRLNDQAHQDAKRKMLALSTQQFLGDAVVRNVSAGYAAWCA